MSFCGTGKVGITVGVISNITFSQGPHDALVSGDLLQENSYDLLLEDGGLILLE